MHTDQTPSPETVDLSRLDDDGRYEQALVLLASVTDDLLDEVRDMQDDDVRAPSLLPGWTRAHVITHVARNADGLRNLLEGAATGRDLPMYASWEARDAEIEAGASRSASDLEADLEASGERFLEAVAGLPLDRRHVEVRTASGHLAPAHDVLWMRIREVAYHHVDLGTGRRFRDLPAAVVARGLPEAVGRVGLDPVEHGVRGSDADVLGWMTGREDGASLSSDGPLPTLRAWG